MHPSRTVLLAAVALPLAAAPALAADTLELVSVSSSGAQGDDASGAPSVSADGRLVAFQSEARDLVPHDANNKFDIFVRDRQTGATELVSTNSRGAQASVGSFTPAISGDGRFVAFQSSAHNFSEFNNSFTDVFVHDRQTGTTEQVSVSSSGVPGNGESGRFSGISISRKGRYVAFSSEASNLVAGDTDDARDVFVRDREAGTTERVSVGPHGAQAEGGEIGSVHPSISADGRYVAFESDATNLVPGDTNGHEDVFVHDRQAGTTERVSVGQGGAQANGDSGFAGLAISGDGRFVAYASDASNLVRGDTNGVTDVFVHDRQAGTTERVSVGQGGVQAGSRSVSPSISGDGRLVAFESVAAKLVPGDTNARADVFVRDRQQGTTERVSVGPGGTQGDQRSGAPSISADGRLVAFESHATDFVPHDVNGSRLDVFAHAR